MKLILKSEIWNKDGFYVDHYSQNDTILLSIDMIWKLANFLF